jgi:hypothetical protein
VKTLTAELRTKTGHPSVDGRIFAGRGNFGNLDLSSDDRVRLPSRQHHIRNQQYGIQLVYIVYRTLNYCLSALRNTPGATDSAVALIWRRATAGYELR